MPEELDDEELDLPDAIAAAHRKGFEAAYAAQQAEKPFPKTIDDHPFIKLLQEGHLLHVATVLQDQDVVLVVRIQNSKVHSAEKFSIEKLGTKTLTEFVNELG